MKEEPKDSTNAASKGWSGGPSPILRGTTSTQPRQDDKSTNGNTGSASSSGPPSSSRGPSRQVSSKKTEANRKNAQKSTGPRTEAGKANAAANSYRHGFFANRLFPTAEQAAKDKADYEAVANGVHAYYQPEGFMENFWVEKVAIEALRLARVLGYEQEKMMSWIWPFESHSGDRILRYQTALNRQLAGAIEELERLQAKRKLDAALPCPPDPEADDTAAEAEEPTPCPGDHADEASTDKAIAESGSAVTTAQAFSKEPEASNSDAAASAENGGTNPPSAGASGQTTDPSPNASDGRPQVREPGSDSP